MRYVSNGKLKCSRRLDIRIFLFLASHLLGIFPSFPGRSCWMKKINNGDKFKLKCKTCGLRVHPACYEISEHDEEEEWECWACQAVGETVKFRERDPKTDQRLTYKVKKRPTECCLCSEPDSDNMHAMHPLFDDYGPKARQIRLKNGKPAWVHTLCAFFASMETGGVVYPCTKDGNFGASPESDTDRIVWDDDSSINSMLEYGDNEIPTGSTHHFAYVTELWYDPKTQGHIKKKDLNQKNSAKVGGCKGCGKNDVGSYRIAIQCMVGEKRERNSLKTYKGQPIHNEDRCSEWWHVGCDRYKKNDKGEYSYCQNVFYYPGTKEHPNQVCNLFCREHAKEKYDAVNEINEKHGKLGAGRRKYESHFPEGCKIESEIGDSGSEASGSENEYSAPSDDDDEDDDDDENLAFGLGDEGNDNDDEDEDNDIVRKRKADQEVDERHQRQRKRKNGNDDLSQTLKKRTKKNKNNRDQAADDGASSGHRAMARKSEPKSRHIRSQEHYETVDGSENEDSIVENDCNGFSLKYIDKLANKSSDTDKNQKLGRKLFRAVISDAVLNYRRVIIGEDNDSSTVPVPFDDPFDSAVIGALFEEKENNDQNQDGSHGDNSNESSSPYVPTAWCQLKQGNTDNRDSYEADGADSILRRFSFHSLNCLQKTTKTAEYCDECMKIKDKFMAKLKALKRSQRAAEEERQQES